MDADTGQIVAVALTATDVDDGAEVGPVLDQISGSVASFTADGAYDQDGVSTAVAERCPEAAIIVPPRSTAVPSETAETAPTQRDRHVQHVEPRGSPDIAEHGRAAWQKASGYTKRARAEAAIVRFKQMTGDGRSRPRFRVRSTWNAGEGCARAPTSVGRPRWTSPSMHSTVCWSSDAQSPSASPDPRAGLG